MTKGFQKFLITPTASMKDAIHQIDELDVKLLIVTSIHGHLLGTVTDGDVRRALLKHLSLNSPVISIMNSEPKTLPYSGTERGAKRLMKKYGLTGIPQVDNNNCVINVLGCESNRIRRNNAVFLMAGGFGKRLRPLTDDCPKPMLKVGERPILETILQQFIDAGFYNFFISTHYLNKQIEDYFGNGDRFGVSISYVNEKTPLGTAGAIGFLPEEAKKLPLLMMNGDLLTQVKFDELLEYHVNEAADLTVAVRDYQMQVPFGVIQHDGVAITEIVEKPVNSYFVNAGIYCLSPEALSTVMPNRLLDMPDLIQNRLNQKHKVAMFPIHEYWLDIGRISDFEQAQADILQFRGVA